MRNEDEFQVVGLTSSDIIDGAEMRLMNLPTDVMREGQELITRFPHLAARALAPPVLAEVYSLDVIGIARYPEYRQFTTVLFLNSNAVKACERFGYELPAPISTLTRAKLPPEVGTLLRAPIADVP